MADELTEPVTDYATPGDSWEAWFADYRFGAMYVFPPEPWRTRVNTLRQHYDPRSQAICQAHISLTVPVPRPLTTFDATELAQAAQAVAPFIANVGPARSYPGIPGVVLDIGPASHFAEMVKRFETCAAFAGATRRPYIFSPHMTMAEFITLERTAEILAELDSSELTGTFPCNAVTYAVPDGDFRFTERLGWPLGRAVHQPQENANDQATTVVVRVDPGALGMRRSLT